MQKGQQREAESSAESKTTSIWGAEHDLAQQHAGGTPAVTPPPSVHAAPGKTRQVWDNPILWREICTWAYGKKVLIVRIGYVLLFAAAALLLHKIVASETLAQADARSILPATAQPLIPLLILSLILLNALAVTSITSERDGKALDLLLVTDLTPKEIIFGKLGGIFFNAKEMILLPMLLAVYMWQQGGISGENLFYLLISLVVVNCFGAMLGLHAGMNYSNSRHAIGVSVGTLLFLMIGIGVCMRMMIAFSSFQDQFQPFMAFMLGGGVGLYIALGLRNPSTAIGIAAFGAPFATFYAITSFLLGFPLTVFLVVCATYGFTTAAMLVPALFEFDVATGRTTETDD